MFFLALKLVAEEAGDDDFGDVRSVGTPTAHTHHSVRRGKNQTSQGREFWFQKKLTMEDKIVERESIERERERESRAEFISLTLLETKQTEPDLRNRSRRFCFSSVIFHPTFSNSVFDFSAPLPLHLALIGV